MTVFDLIFLVGAICTVAALLTAVVQALRGRWQHARRTLARTAVAVTAYLAVVVAVSLATPQRVLPQSERRCWDEWCLTIDRVTRTIAIGSSAVAAPGDVLYIVDVRISSRALRRSQREVGVMLYLLDASDRRYDPDPEAERALAALGLAGDPLDHLMNPAAFIIADGGSLFHKRTRIRFDVVESGNQDGK